MASLPQPADLDWDVIEEEDEEEEEEEGAEPGAQSADASSNHNDSLVAVANSADSPPALAYEEVFRNKEDGTTEVTEPSASEEQLQETITEQK